MSSSPVVAAAFGTVLQAQTFVNRLDAEGIPAHIIDGETATTLGYIGAAIGGVKVHVLPEDLERAQRILGELDGEQTWGEAFADESEWACAQCDAAVPGDHDVCWSCGTPRSADAEATPAFEPVPLEERTTGEDASRPAEVPTTDAEPLPVPHLLSGVAGLAILVALLAVGLGIAVGIVGF